MLGIFHFSANNHPQSGTNGLLIKQNLSSSFSLIIESIELIFQGIHDKVLHQTKQFMLLKTSLYCNLITYTTVCLFL